MEITWIRKGSGVRTIGSRIESFHEGDLCWIGSSIPHTYTSTHSKKTTASWTTLQWNPEIMGPSFWKLPETHSISTLFSNGGAAYHFAPEIASLIRKKLNATNKLSSSSLSLSGLCS